MFKETMHLLMQFSTLYSLKMEIFQTIFFLIFSPFNDKMSFVKHVLDPL